MLKISAVWGHSLDFCWSLQRSESFECFLRTPVRCIIFVRAYFNISGHGFSFLFIQTYSWSFTVLYLCFKSFWKVLAWAFLPGSRSSELFALTLCSQNLEAGCNVSVYSEGHRPWILPLTNVCILFVMGEERSTPWSVFALKIQPRYVTLASSIDLSSGLSCWDLQSLAFLWIFMLLTDSSNLQRFSCR